MNIFKILRFSTDRLHGDMSKFIVLTSEISYQLYFNEQNREELSHITDWNYNKLDIPIVVI